MSLLLQLPLIVGYRPILCTPLLKRQRAHNRFGHERVPSAAAQSSCCPLDICSLYFAAFKIWCLFKGQSASSCYMQLGVCYNGKPCPACAVLRVLL